MKRPPAKNFEDLLVWQKAHCFVQEIYKLTKEFPKEEMFGLTSQLRRSAISIPANIAEGFKRLGTQDKIRFMNIAQSSLEESRYYLILAKDLGYGETTSLLEQLDEIGRILDAYRRSIAVKNSVS